jgi:phosphoglycolate phosphatase-like HAD superfamily hydrolase
VQQRTVAFDLDMTLVDTRPGIHAALSALAEETGYPIDADEIVAGLGPPVAEALAPYVPDAQLTEAVHRFREHMAVIGVTNVAALPGAAVAYVGDHPADMLAAVDARVTGIGVTSGSTSTDELYRAGASTVLDSLEQFGEWFRTCDAAN